MKRVIHEETGVGQTVVVLDRVEEIQIAGIITAVRLGHGNSDDSITVKLFPPRGWPKNADGAFLAGDTITLLGHEIDHGIPRFPRCIPAPEAERFDWRRA